VVYRFLLGGLVVVATIWALSCAAMVLIGLRAVSVGSSGSAREAELPTLVDGLATRTAVLLIVCGTLLGLPLLGFAFWGLATLASGGP
jgi:hypothetical protein